MSCEPEKVTALVDGALSRADTAAVDAHLADCARCRALAQAERAVQQRLRALPQPEMPPGLEGRLRKSLRSRDPRRAGLRALVRVAVPVAAVLALALWVRGLPGLVAWELANDHGHCFSKPDLPATIHSDDPATVSGWFVSRGTPMPRVPARVAELHLVGGRYCYFPDVSAAPHLYYTGGRRPLSLFVLAHGARFADTYRARSSGRNVALVRLGGGIVGVVSEDAADVDAAVLRLQGDSRGLQALRVPDAPAAR